MLSEKRIELRHFRILVEASECRCRIGNERGRAQRMQSNEFGVQRMPSRFNIGFDGECRGNELQFTPLTGILVSAMRVSIVRFTHNCYNDCMSTITVQDIQRDFHEFLRRVEAGESFLLVVRDETSVAEVRPATTTATQPRPYGLCTGRFTVPADFDRPLPDEILKEFKGT